ncbi:SPOR domain-containing protein [Alsobacter sp. KACC 23698]|uniref:SPOR domain-containing protein n=1 Tax=Alsobacter sp. KACC 23698 TaxID=3149229 RepID=A0AAU7JMN4_9HYPH
MNELNRQRPVIDLDELERQLREAAGHRDSARPSSAHYGQGHAPRGAGQQNDDPLAELARIVGQDDPFRALWSDRDGGARDSHPARVEPSMSLRRPAAEPAQEQRPSAPAPTAQSFEDQLSAYETDVAPHGALPYQLRQPAAHSAQERDWDAAPTQAAAYGQAPRPTHAAYDDRYAQAEAEPVYEPEGQLPPHDEDFAEPPRRRRGLMAVGAIMSVAVAGAVGVYAYKGMGPGAVKLAGAPPLIKAEAGPSKVQPQNPGGVEVPNQDRQVYNKSQAPEDLKSVKVSGRAEQPLDVEQITRRDLPMEPPAPSASASTSTGAVAPLKAQSANAGLPALGEPRRVKTVSVRPDGTIIEGEAGPTRVASLASVPPVGVPAPAVASTSTPSGATPAPMPMPRPKLTSLAPMTTGSAPAKPARPVVEAETTTATTAPAPVAAPAPKPAPAARQQVASAPATTAAPQAEAASGGGFAVQLAAPQSETEARDVIAKLQKRFSGELAGLNPGVRKADVNGKTIYRVRVSGMSRDEATALCTKLQGAGGQCFVAKN